MTTLDQKQTGTKWLEQGGVRPTRQRVTLAALLVGDGHHRHVTAESLYDAVRNNGEKVSLATVYNTLSAFSDAGLLREITVNGTKSYFDTDISNHAHFYWEETGELQDAGHGPGEVEVQVTNLPEPPAGAEIAKVDVVISLRKHR
ncbi:MAG: Fur family transcriptional regulator [Maritimibacter sp.]|jgi:Fur family transcriptional regulator, iron response regulator